MLVTLRYGPRKISGISGMSLYLATLSIKILKKEKKNIFLEKGRGGNTDTSSILLDNKIPVQIVIAKTDTFIVKYPIFV